MIIWTWKQHGDDFLVCGLTSNLEVLADEFKNNFLVKKAEIVSLKPEHQDENHFLKRRTSVDNFGWHVELDVGDSNPSLPPADSVQRRGVRPLLARAVWSAQSTGDDRK